jgi:hypothetical protein
MIVLIFRRRKIIDGEHNTNSEVAGAVQKLKLWTTGNKVIIHNDINPEGARLP